MSISAIGSSSYTNPYATIKDDFNALSSALKSGSLSDAQKAYATLKTDTTSQTSNANNPMAQDLASLGSSLDSGSLADAQQTFAKMQKLMKGHGDFARQQVAMQTTDAATSDSQSTSDGTADTIGNDVKSLSSALASGNVSDAEKALATLQKDVASKNGDTSANDPFSKDLASLGDSLQSGDLSGAQQKFAQIQQKMSQAPQGPPPGPPPSASANGSSSGSTLDTDLQNLSSALQSGNASDAQKAFATLQSDLASQQSDSTTSTTSTAATTTSSTQGAGATHHHHHAGTSASSGSTTNTTDSAAATGSASGSTTESLADYLKSAVASYLQASSSGNGVNGSSSLLTTATYM